MAERIAVHKTYKLYLNGEFVRSESRRTDADGARREVGAAIDCTVWYAGWCDKFVALASSRNPVAGPHFTFSTSEPAECIATCDLPGGTCNVLTGKRAELGAVLASHADVDALAAFGLPPADEKKLAELAAASVMRTRFKDAPDGAAWYTSRYDDLERVLAFTEVKTIWHPARI